MAYGIRRIILTQRRQDAKKKKTTESAEGKKGTEGFSHEGAKNTKDTKGRIGSPEAAGRASAHYIIPIVSNCVEVFCYILLR